MIEVVSRVPLEESIGLLKMAPYFVPSDRSWIRIAKPKLYRGDLAFVIHVDSQQRKVDAIFVPRIGTSCQAKRKSSEISSLNSKQSLHRPAQALFSPEVVQAVYGEDSVETSGQVFKFKGTSFKNGFVNGFFPLSNFFPDIATPTMAELSVFQSFDGISLEDIGLAYLQRFATGDNVKVVSGQLKGLVGKVTESSDDTVAIEFMEIDRFSTVSVPAHDVRKRFQIGDQVRVLFGAHCGAVG